MASQRLLLTSAGIVPEISDLFLSLLPKDPSEISVSFITTAGYGEMDDPSWFDNDRQLLRRCGISKIIDFDIKGKDQKQIEAELSKSDIILVEGGNTFYLMHHMKKSGFDKALPGLLNNGKLYVGISAGSYVACPTIEAAGWEPGDENKIKLKDLTALNLVPFLLTAHFEDQYRSAVEKATLTTKYPVIALRNTQAILVEGNNYKLVGEGDRNFYNGFAENWITKRKSR